MLLRPVGGPQPVTGWTTAWMDAAEHAERSADRELADDGLAAACRWYLRAAECYRLTCREPSISVEERRRWSDAQASAFRAALPLLDHPATVFSLNVGRTLVAGYLFRPDDSGHELRTAVCPAAHGELAESGCLGCGTTILDVGMNYLTYAPVPATHSATSAAQYPIDHDDVLEAVVQWACRQRGVDLAGLLIWPTGAAPA